MFANFGQDCGELSRGERRRCATTEINRLDRSDCGYIVLSRQSNLLHEGSDKGFCAAFTINLKIEGAEVASLSAEGDVEVQTDGRGYRHDRLNPCGLEKSLAMTISISSAGDFPRLRMCVCQDLC